MRTKYFLIFYSAKCKDGSHSIGQMSGKTFDVYLNGDQVVKEILKLNESFVAAVVTNLIELSAAEFEIWTERK